MVQAKVYLDEKQLELLSSLCKHRKDDNKDDILDETFISNIFKIGLIDTVYFYSKSEKDPELSEKANDYMSHDMLGADLNADDLKKLWGIE